MAPPAEEEPSAAAREERLESLSQVAGVLGTQWGDEGKGKLVDILAKRFDVVARCQVSSALARFGRSLFCYLSLIRMMFDGLLLGTNSTSCSLRRRPSS